MVKRVQPTTEQIHELVRTNPLGLVITHVDGEALSTLLPIVLDPSGEMLHGHFGAKNPQIDALREHPRALLIFQGPSSYISPSWLRDRTQAPTWFYTFVEFQVAIDFIDDERGVRQNLEQLVAHLEEGHGSRWHLTELGERYAMLSRGVRPFTARILGTRARFKLGQGDRADVVSDSIDGLRQRGKLELAAMVGQAARSPCL